jgi:hypothetical protein
MQKSKIQMLVVDYNARYSPIASVLMKVDLTSFGAMRGLGAGGDFGAKLP